jgi:hypothetical protein
MENGHATPEGLTRKIRLLELAGVAGAADEPLDIASLARELGASSRDLRAAISQLVETGLLFSGLDEGLAPIVSRAGSQFVERDGRVPREVLRFLSRFVDDLHGREALLRASTVLVGGFRDQLLQGVAVEHAARLVPPGFAAAVNEGLALDLFAAAVALMVRLSDERPAGCVAEEIIAVGLLEGAEEWLGERFERGELTAAEQASAAEEMRGLFELLGDDDVLGMWARRAPDDAATGGRGQLKQQIGVADRRVESWFVPFGWVIPAGYIGD